MRKRKYKYDFAGKKESEQGRASLVYAGISLCMFAIAFLAMYMGLNEIISGAVGLGATLLSLIGFFMSLFSFQDRNRSHNLSAAGLVLNGLLAVGWVSIYLAGIN